MHCRWYPIMPCSRSRGGGVVSQHALQVSRPTPRGEVEGSGPRGCPGPHPRGKLRGLAWGGLQAHTQWGLQEHTQGDLQAYTWGGVSQHALRQTPPDSYCCGWYASYWNAFLLPFVLGATLLTCCNHLGTSLTRKKEVPVSNICPQTFWSFHPNVQFLSQMVMYVNDNFKPAVVTLSRKQKNVKICINSKKDVSVLE